MIKKTLGWMLVPPLLGIVLVGGVLFSIGAGLVYVADRTFTWLWVFLLGKQNGW